MTSGIAAKDVSWSVRKQRLLSGVCLEAVPGRLVGLLGPNGSGKTTCLRLLAGLRKPETGSVSFDGVDLHEMPRRVVARRLAVVEQDLSAHTDLTVRQVVEIGRTPFRGRFDALTPQDQEIIDGALRKVDLLDLQNRHWHSMSGGEQQRAQLARALAQEPREILLDEPTNHLDIRHQLELLELLRSIEATCVIALHDLNLAARYCDHLVILDRGSVAAAGAPEQTLTPQLISRVYGVEAGLDREPVTGCVRITFHGSTAR